LKSKNFFSLLEFNDQFLQAPISSWETNKDFIQAKEVISCLKGVNDTAERAVKLMQDFHGLLTADEAQKQFVLQCVSEHRKIYPDCKKEILKRKYQL
jgi:hypothetical protein